MFNKFNKLLYKTVFNLYEYEGIQNLIVYDTRDKTLILNDLFHLFDNEEKGVSSKDVFINKIKNKELNISLIDDNFINVLSNIEKIRNKIVDIIKLNSVSKLKHYFIKHNLLISYINHDAFDLLIYAIQNNMSMDMIKENENINDLLNVILIKYINDVSFILKLLSIYKNKIKLSKNQLNTLLLNENSKIPIEWLFQAIDNDNLDLIKLLIHHGINTNKKSKNGESPLFRALKINSIKQYNDKECINKNNVKIISYLIQNNANVNEILNNGDNILIYAIKRNNINIIKDLISYGADIFNEKCKKKSNTAISVAFKTGRDELIKYLIEYIVAHNQNELLQDSNLINLSIENCSEDITNLLIEKGTKVDNKVCIANAIYMDYDNTTIKYLIEHGADVNKKGNCNKRPLHIAIENKKEDIIKYLVDSGANYNDNGSLILNIAIKNNISKSSIQYLIEHIVEINESIKYDLSKSLINAIHYDDELLAKYLVDSGAD
eukprot:jgi/Orpsp1_1/1174038/evm.model.c7180000048662.1